MTAARKQVFYRAQVNRESSFGRQVGYPGSTWNGAFVDSVLREAGYHEVSTISTVAALAYFVGKNRLYKNPRPGDIVFYSFATNPRERFEQPHIGIVTETDYWKLERTFRAIEGETGTGKSRGSQEIDGVFERERGAADVIGFARPRRPAEVTLEPTDEAAVLKASYFTSNPTTRSRAVTNLQRALAEVTGRGGFSRGLWDPYTESVLNEFRRNNGMVGKTGLPDDRDIAILGKMTNHHYFRTGDGDAQ